MYRKKLIRQKGQTLLEIVVALAVIVVLVMGVIVATTNALKSARFSKSKSVSVQYAQEGMEIMRTLRDESWTTFFTYGDITSKEWCMDKNGVLSLASGTCPFTIDNIYNRKLTVTWEDPKMKVESLVSWNEGSQIYETTLTTYLTDWR